MRAAMALVMAALAIPAVANPSDDPIVALSLRRDVLSYYISLGATPEQACAVSVRYFGGYCTKTENGFVVGDQPGNSATFYAVIELEN